MTDPRQKVPVLRIVAGMALAEGEWTALDAEGREQAGLVDYRPGRWAAAEAYVVVRQLPEGEPGLLEPRYTVMLVSRDDLPVAELGRGHRSQQGQENARKGPLTDLGRHHPPGKSYEAHQAFHWCGQIAQLLLRLLQYQLRPGEARRHGLRPLLRHCVRTVGRVVRSGRRQKLLPGRGNLRLD